MAIDPQHFARIRPRLYHLTAAVNVDRIFRTRRLLSATRLFADAGRDPDGRRRECVQLRIGDDVVHVRDQAPLHAGNIDFQSGWCFEDLLADLNRRVYFWAGKDVGPSAYGVRHFQRYRSERPAILRISTAELLHRNEPALPQFCRFNSGSPRCVNGRKSPRGRETFVPAAVAPFRASDVVELTFVEGARLPPGTEIGFTPSGPWKPLWEKGK